MKNIFIQQAEKSSCKAEQKTFLELAYYLQAHGIDRTRIGIGYCIEAAQALNDQGAVFFYSFALNEVHS